MRRSAPLFAAMLLLSFVLAGVAPRSVHAEVTIPAGETIFERLQREHPATAFRLLEAVQTDDPLEANYVQDLLEQYDAAVSDRSELKGNLSRVTNGFLQSGERVTLLEEHLAGLASDIRETEIAVRQTEQQRRTVERRVLEHQRAITARETEIAKQEQIVGVYLRALQTNVTRSGLELFLVSDTFAQAVDTVSYLETVKDEGARSIAQLEELQRTLLASRDALKIDQRNLTDVEQSLAEQRTYLADQRRAKEFLLVRTRGQQVLYEQLLQQVQEKEAEVDRELQEIIDALSTIADPQSLLNLAPQDRPMDGRVSAQGFIWPVPPLKVTTFFREASYRKFFGFEHNAVDLRAAQGSDVRAAADGVVVAAKDNGKGYSFVVLLHRDKISTVYGHLSSIGVTEGAVVRRGTVIGKSGGHPGSDGAGPFTTGPHLHFEVRVRGAPQNPLDYLP